MNHDRQLLWEMDSNEVLRKATTSRPFDRPIFTKRAARCLVRIEHHPKMPIDPDSKLVPSFETEKTVQSRMEKLINLAFKGEVLRKVT
jgi:hypothetical protein